jgi:hypothetical protein
LEPTEEESDEESSRIETEDDKTALRNAGRQDESINDETYGQPNKGKINFNPVPNVYDDTFTEIEEEDKTVEDDYDTKKPHQRKHKKSKKHWKAKGNDNTADEVDKGKLPPLNQKKGDKHAIFLDNLDHTKVEGKGEIHDYTSEESDSD